MVRNWATRQRRIAIFARCLALAMCFLACILPGWVNAADLRIIAPNAVKEIVTDVAARYERESGDHVVFTWGGSEAIAKRINDGEGFDVVLNTPDNLDTLGKAGKISAGTRTDFAKSGIGVAVRAGLPRPDVSDEKALRRALLEARTVGISSGPSGRYMAELFERLGIATQIRGKIMQPPSGTQIAQLLSSGEVELGFQQISELQHAPGVEYLGPLPVGFQTYTIWSGAVHLGAHDPARGRAFLHALRSPESVMTIRHVGMEPM